MKKVDLRVRAIAQTTSNKLLFIKRVRENANPYWVFIGGGVEEDDTSLESALKRELFEEANAVCDVMQPVYIIERDKEDVKQYEIYFIAKIQQWSEMDRVGEEILDAKNGLYIIEEVPINNDLCNINILPEEVKNFIFDHKNNLSEIPVIDISSLVN